MDVLFVAKWICSFDFSGDVFYDVETVVMDMTSQDGTVSASEHIVKWEVEYEDSAMWEAVREINRIVSAFRRQPDFMSFTADLTETPVPIEGGE